MRQKNVKLLQFGKDAVARTGTLVSGQLTDASLALASTGEIFVVTEDNYIVSTAGTLPTKFKVVYKSGNGTFVFSDVIDRSTIKNYFGKKSVEAVEQISYIGYNGTSESVEAITNNNYIVRVFPLETEAYAFNINKTKHATFSTSSTAYQTTVVDGMLPQLVANFSKDAERSIKFERVCSHAGAVIIGTVANFGCTYKSKYVTLDGTVTNVSAGDYLRIGGTGVTSPMYKVSSITSGTSVTLDTEFQGTSGNVLTASVEVVTAAQALTVDWGIKCTGIAKTWALDKFPFKKVRFDITLEDFGTTIVTHSTAATEGSGKYQSVAELEYFCQGNESFSAQRDMTAGPLPTTFRTDYTFNNYYSILSFDFSDKLTTSLGQGVDSLKQLVIAFGAAAATSATTGTSNTGAVTSAINVLDAIVVAAGTGTAQTGNL